MGETNFSTYILGILVCAFIFGSAGAEGSEVSITDLKYTNDFEKGEAVNLIPSGKNQSTTYSYKIFDDNDDFPEDWEEKEFDDSSWEIGNAPFGNKANEATEPGTIWQSEYTEGSDGDKDYIIIRKDFFIEDKNAVLGATVKSAYTNYYAVYLNGQNLQNCLSYSGGCYEGNAEYWNKVVEIEVSLLIEGENTIVLVGRDSLWQGGDNTTWLDCELDLRVQAWSESQVILGDDVMFKVDFRNDGDSNLTELNVSLKVNNDILKEEEIDIPRNSSYEWLVEWKPQTLGYYNITATILNESITKVVHVGFYAYSLEFVNTHKESNVNDKSQFEFLVINEGDVYDNFSFSLVGIPDEWDFSFRPEKAKLAPDESVTITLNITTSENAQSGNYSLWPIIRSQYYARTSNDVIQSGLIAGTEYNYRIWNASEFSNDFYKPNFDTSNWTLGHAPFGNDELNGVNPNTVWQTEDSNYTYITIRQAFNYTNGFNFSELQLNLAHDDYYRAYLNGELIRDCLSWSWGCGGNGQYWSASLSVNTSWLKEGENLIAIAARDETYQGGDGRQWLDLHLETLTLKSSLWNFKDIYEELTISVNETYDFEILVPIVQKYIEDDEYVFTIWVINRGNVKDQYDISITLNDTVAFNLESYNEFLEIPYGEDRDVELRISLTENINEFSVGELFVNITSRNSTELLSGETTVFARLYVIPDTLPPGTFAESDVLVNSSSFEVRWYVEDWYKDNEVMGNDTKYFIIEYSTDSGSNGETWSEWIVWENFSSEQSSGLFTNAIDGYWYKFRSIGVDNEGLIENKEDKYDTKTIVDTSAPEAVINLRIQGNITNINYIEIEWSVTHPNITEYRVEYRLNNAKWLIVEESTLARWIGFNIPSDGIYEFRVITSDQAGNKGISDVSQEITVDTTKPSANLQKLASLTGSEEIEIHIENADDTENVTLYYYVAREGQEIMPILWDNYGDYLVADFPIKIPVDNQFHYFFKITAYDNANNQFINESYEDIIVDKDRPTEIRNLEITEKDQSYNGSIDVGLSFMSSQAQDLEKYRIYKSTSINETGDMIIEFESDELYLTHTDPNVDRGFTYYYSVVAVDRMSLESEPVTGLIVIEKEEETGITNGDEESSNTPILIGAGIVGLVSLAGSGFYFASGKKEEVTAIIADITTDEKLENETDATTVSKFTDVGGEFLCSACGSMFEMNKDRTCPSCGIMDD